MLANRICEANYIPGEIRKAFRRADIPDKGDLDYRRTTELWREVAARLTLDALGYTGETEELNHIRAMRGARLWFRHQSEDVVMVFEFAGIHPDIVIQTMVATKPLTRFFKTATDDSPKSFEVVIKSKKKAGTPCPVLKSSPSKSPIPKNSKSPRTTGTPSQHSKMKGRLSLSGTTKKPKTSSRGTRK